MTTKLLIRLGFIITAATFATTALRAQTAPIPDASSGELAEIVVTAQRRDELLKDVPISTTVFTAADLDINRITDIGQYFDRTPNVNFDDSGGDRQSRAISMRGITDLAGGIGGSSSTFGFYVDDFNTASTTVNPNLFDVERIEILRGPQPTYFGRNAIGGAVNIILNKPAPDFYADVAAGIARFDTDNVDAVVNVPITDKFFVRASIDLERSNGFVENVNPAGGTSGHDYDHGHIAARWLAAEGLTFDLSYDREYEHQGILEEVPTGIPDPSLVPTFYTTPDLTGTGAYPQNKTRVNLNLPDRLQEDISITNARATYQTSAFTLTSITGYIYRERDHIRDLDFSPLDVVRTDEPYRYGDASEEIRLQSAGNNIIDWSTGITYAHFHRTYIQEIIAGKDFFGGAYQDQNINDYQEHDLNTTWSGFGEVVYHATPKLSFTGGGRYTSDKVGTGIYYISFFQNASVPFTETRTFDFSPRFAVNYQFTDQITGYISAAKGFKAGGVQPSTIEEPNYKKETLWNYEVGIKGLALDRRLRFSFAVYDMQWKNLQVNAAKTVTDPDTGAIQFLFGIANAAKASSRGAELELTALPVEHTEIGISAGYDDAKFDSFPNAVVNDAPPALMNPDGTVNLSGKPIPLATKWNFSPYVQQSANLSATASGFVRGEFIYRSSYVDSDTADVSTNPYYSAIPSRQLFNLRAGVNWPTFKAIGFVDNVFDRDWYSGSFDNFSYVGKLVTPHPRRFGIRLEKEFK